MVLFLSLLCALFSGFLITDRLFLGGAYYALLPLFSATAAALVGVIIAGLEYRARKAKKKRRAPMALIIANAIAGSVAAALWLWALVGNNVWV